MSNPTRSIETNSVVSHYNNTTTTLGANEVFTGQGESVLDYKCIILNIVSDVDSAAGGVSVQFSQDNVNWDQSFADTYIVSSGHFYEIYSVVSRYSRIVYTNGDTDQSSFRLQTLYHRYADPSVSSSGGSGSSTTVITPDPILQGAFGRLRVANPETLFQVQHTDLKTGYLQDEQLTNGGTTFYQQDQSAIDLEVSTVGDKVIRQSRRYITYQPGKSLLILMTGVLNSDNNDSGTTSKIGYFDDNNGIFFEYDGTNVNIVLRSKSTGSVVNTIVSQDNWNLDKLDGNGASGLILDPSKTQIFLIDLQWLGVGRVRTGLVVKGITIYVHQFLHANIQTTTYMSRGSLPARYEIESTSVNAGGRLKEICSSVVSEGGLQPIGTPFSANRRTTAQTISNGAEAPLIAIRLKSQYVRAGVKLSGYTSLLNSGNLLVQIRHYLAPTSDIFSGGASWISAGSDSFVEYDVSATTVDTSVSNQLAFSSYFSNDSEDISRIMEKSIYLATDISGNHTDIIVLTGVNAGNNGNRDVFGSLEWLEFD